MVFTKLVGDGDVDEMIVEVFEQQPDIEYPSCTQCAGMLLYL